MNQVRQLQRVDLRLAGQRQDLARHLGQQGQGDGAGPQTVGHPPPQDLPLARLGTGGCGRKGLLGPRPRQRRRFLGRHRESHVGFLSDNPRKIFRNPGDRSKYRQTMGTQLKVRPARDGDASTPIIVGNNLVGQTIGSYRVTRELGEGGMGCVYLAEHTLIGRKAAVKVLNPDISSDPEVASRFFTEARAVNDIRHPNIVEVTDFGRFGAYYCIVMEYLEGETLAARMGRVRVFDETGVIRVMKQCTSALGAAHEQGLVHRDIKPENIFLRAHPDYPDFVKLLDFGIAKLLTADETVGHKTKTGSVLGTPSYMSPEQCLGEAALDIRSDVYSLGVVIYQMLTGQLPFTADTLGRLIVCHVSELPVPPSVINPSVSRAMNDLVLRTLAKRPKDRFQSARDMRDALERLLPPQLRALAPDSGAVRSGDTRLPTRIDGPPRDAQAMPTPVTVGPGSRPLPDSGAVPQLLSGGTGSASAPHSGSARVAASGTPAGGPAARAPVSSE